MMPTASAVVGDLIDIARDIIARTWRRVPLRSYKKDQIEDIRLLPMDDVVANYYFRFSAVDRPGVLSNISGILGKHDISISSVIQKEKKFDKDKGVPVVLTTYKAREKNVRMALEEIDNTLEDVVFGKTTLIRIEDESLR